MGVADVVIVAGLCLAVPWLHDPARALELGGWVTGVAGITVMSCHWHLPAALAWPATAAVSGAYLIGLTSLPDVGVVDAWHPAAWIAVEGALSALVWTLVRRGGSAADALVARQLEAQRAADLAAARRAAERTHWAAVHDTVATTLLMLGSGEVRDGAPWLPAQLRRDLAALAGVRPATDSVPVDLLTDLRACLDAAPAPPSLEHHGRPATPPAVAAAIVGAVTEAVENARRHSGGAIARVRVEDLGDRVVVTVRDRGCGFDADASSRGRGLRWSVVERMADAGGRAWVESAPGAGTTVRLEWPDA